MMESMTNELADEAMKVINEVCILVLPLITINVCDICFYTVVVVMYALY